MMEKQISLINNETFDSLDKTKKSKIYFLSMNDLNSNPMNQIYEDQDTQEDLEEIMDSIRETGLQQPLIVSKSDNSYVLLSGHRRKKVLMILFEEHAEVRYNGIVLDDENIPVIIQYEYKTKEEQFKALVASNCYRHISKETNKKLIAEAVKIYNIHLSSGQIEPGRTRDNIAKLANVDGRTVQRYVDIGEKGKPVKMKDESQQKDLTDRLKTKLAGIEKYFTNLDVSEIDDLSTIKDIAIPAINVMIQRLDIDPREL